MFLPGTGFPVWAVYLLVLLALAASHAGLLGLPYYWDEAGYFIPAAWDLLRTGSLIPITTLTNAHPPLPSLWLALAWRVFDFSPLVTRLAVLAVAALGITGVWRLAIQLGRSKAVALWTVLLTALYPVWFSQSVLAHADIFAAACLLWGLSLSLPGEPARPWKAAIWFACAALAKETAVLFPLVLAGQALVSGLRRAGSARCQCLVRALWLLLPVVPLAAWFAYHFMRTGFVFGNPEFLRYNAGDNLLMGRFMPALVRRVLHLTVYLNLFVPLLLAVGSRLLPARAAVGQKLPPSALRTMAILAVSSAVFFSVLGGALLPRYLLPVYPLILLWAVVELKHRTSWWQPLCACVAIAFVAALMVNPPYRFVPEDNLAWTRFVRFHQAAIEELNHRYPGASVLTAWPATDELRRPELGYTADAFNTVNLQDFSAAEIEKAAQDPGQYSMAMVFSTKYEPRATPFSLGVRGRANDERYFGLHHDLSPEQIAHRLNGQVVFRREEQGQWVALIRFDRQQEARLAPPLVRSTASAPKPIIKLS